MDRESKVEDSVVEAPHCVGCSHYIVKERLHSRPKEICLGANVEINSGYIARRSQEKCPLGKGKYGKSRNSNSELRRAPTGISSWDIYHRAAGQVLDNTERSSGSRREVVSSERANAGELHREDSVRERLEVREAAMRLERRFLMRGEVVPEGYRICIPVASAFPETCEAPVPSSTVREIVYRNGRWCEVNE